jgi:hypothetical protein
MLYILNVQRCENKLCYLPCTAVYHLQFFPFYQQVMDSDRNVMKIHTTFISFVNCTRNYSIHLSAWKYSPQIGASFI